MPTEKYPVPAFFIIVVISLGGLLFGYDIAISSGAGRSFENQFIVPVEASSFNLNLFKNWSTYAIVLVFFIAGGFVAHSLPRLHLIFDSNRVAASRNCWNKVFLTPINYF